MPNVPKIRVLGRHISLLPFSPTQDVLADFGDDSAYAALFCNVHMLMLSRQDSELASAMEGADYVFADGVPIAWLQSRITGRKAHVLRGYEAVEFLCAHAEVRGKTVGFYGSKVEVLDPLGTRLKSAYPSLHIGLMHAPPYIQGELETSQSDLNLINGAKLDYLFVGLGCPKQEKWIHRYADELNCSVLGVGAAFDWLAGTAPMPPPWMAKSGLGWLYRLVREPRRLWKRYLVYNTVFIFAVAGALVRRGFAAGAKRE